MIFKTEYKEKNGKTIRQDDTGKKTTASDNTSKPDVADTTASGKKQE
jgi:hypothetical protein